MCEEGEEGEEELTRAEIRWAKTSVVRSAKLPILTWVNRSLEEAGNNNGTDQQGNLGEDHGC